MMYVPRSLLIILAIIFASYHAVLGYLWLELNDSPVVVIVALALYLVSVMVSILWLSRINIPLWLATLNLLVAYLVPVLINQQLDAEHLGDYATWYVLGIGTLMATTAIRGHLVIAWAGTAALIIEILLWGGWERFGSTGLPGALALIVTGHAISVGLQRAAKEAADFQEQAEQSVIASTMASSAEKIRTERLGQTLGTALPMLTKIAQQSTGLTEDEKAAALLLEAQLRDEIRGRGLLTDKIRAAVKAARVRGVTVLLLDEGGLDELEPGQRSELMDRVVDAIGQVQSGRLTIRSPKGESWRVTVAAVRPGQNSPDLWLQLS
ncbi:MAG: hypothetical protein RLZZ229_649 [Actinomycetota bacterium]|jgi:hypothetical protein